MSNIEEIVSIDTVASAESPEMFGVVVIGFLFVMIVLAVIAAVTSAFGSFFVKKAAADLAKASKAMEQTAEAVKATAETAKKTAEASSQAVLASRRSKEVDEEEDPLLATVISAAVYTMLKDRPHRIVSIRPTGPGWAQEGRRQIFSSHRVR